MTSPQGLTDEQVETLLQALLDFHSLLTGLSNRLQSKLAAVEQQIAQERTGIPLTPAPALSLLPELPTSSAETAVQISAPPVSVISTEIPVYELTAANQEAFSMIDFDDDEG